MTISATARTSLSLGARPAGSPILTKINNPIIYAIGDSNTKDTGFSLDNTGNSWRNRLHLKLVASGITPTWVGNNSDGTAPSNHHRGIPGATMADHQTGGLYDSVQFVAALAPTLCIIVLGTNDSDSDAKRDSFDTDGITLATQMMAASAALRRFVVCKIYPRADPTGQARIDVINNTKIPSLKTGIEGAGGSAAVADLRVLLVNGHLRQSEGAAAKHVQTQDGWELVAAAMFPAVVNACGYNTVWVGDTVS